MPSLCLALLLITSVLGAPAVPGKSYGSIPAYRPYGRYDKSTYYDGPYNLLSYNPQFFNGRHFYGREYYNERVIQPQMYPSKPIEYEAPSYHQPSHQSEYQQPQAPTHAPYVMPAAPTHAPSYDSPAHSTPVETAEMAYVGQFTGKI